MAGIELWGGVECTVNRVADRYRDQLRLSGHHDRLDDLDRFAALGITAMRYPVLWERTAPGGAPDWTWPDARLTRLAELGIRPIIGLVHHGSGPPHTHLLDPGFAVGLGRFAQAVAQRYPWVEDWTPVNEPVTTARFAALYGHWYPHATDARSFWLALLNQVDATRLAMAAIRRVNPAARLVQTDDLGRTCATPPLRHQADHDNLRRWAGWDLLFGRVGPDHPLSALLTPLGFGDRLRAIADDPCPPAVIGVNHYLTSDRFLDHRTGRYPEHLRGENGRDTYVDTEAVRALDPSPGGLASALRETWQRYRMPIALTEVHNGSTREEQVRWAAQAWDTAHAVTAEGADIRAVTAWALLGSYGWNTLLTADGVYEPGLFDVTAAIPRPTALATLWRDLATGGSRHPVASERGWWQRPERLTYAEARPTTAAPSSDGRPLLICGAHGTLGRAFVRACTARGITHVAAGRDHLDITNGDMTAAILSELNPWAVVNAAGWVRVDDAEDDEAACHQINAVAATALAQACASGGIVCLNLSSDLVFAGDAGRPLVESDAPQPLGAYGRSKAAMEVGCAHLRGSLVVRTAAFFSPYDPYNFAAHVVSALASKRPFPAADDIVVTPTYVPALVDTALDLLIDDMEGIWHLSSGEAVSWAEFGRRVAAACDHDPDLIRPVPSVDLRWRAPRPRYAPLASERSPLSVTLDDMIERFAREHAVGRAQAPHVA
jgi:dTDP-4-dehydrorhamnose reductase